MKRFNYVLGDGFTDYMMHLTATEVCDLLNELHEENEQLRKENNTLKQSLEEDITRRVEIKEVCKERWG